MEPAIRRAASPDAPAAAAVWLRSRDAAVPQIPPRTHSETEVLDWFTTVVLPELEVWVAETEDGRCVGVMVLGDGWLEQLYIDPGAAGLGLGSRFIALAKERQAGGLQLWTFQSNSPARRFYERRGFVAVEETDGSRNEEGAPDVRYAWPPPRR